MQYSWIPAYKATILDLSEGRPLVRNIYHIQSHMVYSVIFTFLI